MKLPRRQFMHLAAGAAALPRVAWAQAYPARAVRVIVPFAPGGLTDVFARLAAQKLTEHFGRQFYVENISGASGNIGTGQARLLHDLLPKAVRVAVLLNPANVTSAEATLRDVQEAAPAIGLQIQILNATP
jgi:tripartite-type tricarboxylate transporter receptor subunit TctC